MFFDFILNKISGDSNQKYIDKLLPIVNEINKIDKSWDDLSDEQIKLKTDEFKQRIKNGELLDKLLPEAFATVKQACKRMY
jgi:preprotein translocase subunit SecA